MKRYMPHPTDYAWESTPMAEDDNGEFVKFEDANTRISTLMDNYATLKDITERQHEAMNQMSIDRSGYLTKIKDLKGEVSKLNHRERTEANFMEVDTDMLDLLLTLATDINEMNGKR